MRSDAIDLKYAREVAEYLHADHTEVIITPEDVHPGAAGGRGAARHV